MSDFKVGDKVRTTWPDGRSELRKEMQPFVGKVGEITYIEPGYLEVHGWRWPTPVCAKPTKSERITALESRMTTAEALLAEIRGRDGGVSVVDRLRAELAEVTKERDALRAIYAAIGEKK